MRNNIKVIDLFAGCGGFSTGFIKAGYTISKAVEFDANIAKIYSVNHKNTKLYVNDIGKINDANHFCNSEAEVIIGGPPCQGFSMAGARIRSNFVDDPRNYLFKQYLKVVKIVEPKVFIIENVKGILTMHDGKIFNEILKVFSDKGNFNGNRYYLHYKVIKAKEYGVPQKRERVIIVGSKDKDFDFDKLLIKTRKTIIKAYPHYFDDVNVWDAIGNLPKPTTDGKIVNPLPLSNYQKFLSSGGKYVFNHTMPKHSKVTKERMSKIKPGQNYTSLSENINSVHSGSYGRLIKTGYCPTITTRFDTPSGGGYTHPTQNRVITPREGARIQSFPDDFIFVGNKSIICKTIGNAVPPKIACFFGYFIKELLNER